MNRKFDPDSFLPLSPLEYQIMAALAHQPSNGLALIAQCSHHSEGIIEPGKSALYKALRRLEAATFISCVQTRVGRSPHQIRIYAPTTIGWLILEQETSRLRQITAIAGTALIKHKRNQQSWAETTQALEPKA
jgi:DNA-binding PadR family transcriptional regulator